MEHKLENWQWKLLSEFDDIQLDFINCGFWEDGTPYAEKQWNNYEDSKLVLNVKDDKAFEWYVEVANGVKFCQENEIPEELQINTDDWDYYRNIKESVLNTLEK